MPTVVFSGVVEARAGSGHWRFKERSVFDQPAIPNPNLANLLHASLGVLLDADVL